MFEAFDNPELIVKNAFGDAGLSWCSIFETSSEIVLFGSQAMGFARRDSDIDVLIVGVDKGRMRTRISTLDLIRIDQDRIQSENWLGSELAFHIKKYGIWLKGGGQWRTSVEPSYKSKIEKRRRIYERSISVIENSRHLSSRHMCYHLTKIRRDCQRAVDLEDEVPGTCSLMLDQKWMSTQSRLAWFFAELEKSGLSKENAEFLVRIAEAENV